MKVMIVCHGLFGEVLTKILQDRYGEDNVRLSYHESALSDFLDMEPDCVLIGECEKGAPEETSAGRGKITFKDLKAAAAPGQKIIRMGFFSQAEADDFIQLPFKPEDLYKILE